MSNTTLSQVKYFINLRLLFSQFLSLSCIYLSFLIHFFSRNLQLLVFFFFFCFSLFLISFIHFPSHIICSVYYIFPPHSNIFLLYYFFFLHGTGPLSTKITKSDFILFPKVKYNRHTLSLLHVSAFGVPKHVAKKLYMDCVDTVHEHLVR
jgi:hypothetical protein